MILIGTAGLEKRVCFSSSSAADLRRRIRTSWAHSTAALGSVENRCSRGTPMRDPTGPWKAMRNAARALAACAIGLGACRPEPPAVAAADPALELHQSAIVVDTHSDTTPRFEDAGWRFGERHDSGDMDLPRIREGGLDVEFWSIYMGERPDKGTAIREALERIDAVHEMVRRYAPDVVLARSAADIRAAVAQGRFVSLMGVEGGHIIEESLPALRSFYALGVRYMTLTHSFHTSWADSSGTEAQPLAPLHHGLTDFGRQVVAEMNRLGMLVDVSHVSDETFADALEVTRAPVIASHSSCRAVCNHARNLSDDMLRALARNGGVVMINFYPGYNDPAAGPLIAARRKQLEPQLEALRAQHGEDREGLRQARQALFEANPLPGSPLSVLLDHFDHAVRVAGPDHVGLGADWDGVPSMPDELPDVSALPELTRGLLARGHSAETVRKVLGENLLRVLEAAERVAASPLAGASAAPPASR
jgi:membrane dipeptidase